MFLPSSEFFVHAEIFALSRKYFGNWKVHQVLFMTSKRNQKKLLVLTNFTVNDFATRLSAHQCQVVFVTDLVLSGLTPKWLHDV